jgi:hypothetical protein
MAKEYFLAPNFTTAPSPEGPIKLGSIIRNINEFEPLNQSHQAIPTTQLSSVYVQESVDISLDELHSGNASLMARALEVLGLAQRTEGIDGIISCEHLETQAFNPTLSYIRDSMDDRRVRSFMRSSMFRIPVYMVTGLKVARGASFVSQAESWKGSTDFIVAFKVKKLWIDRNEQVHYQGHTKRAVMADNTPLGDEVTFTLRSDDHLTPEEVDHMLKKRT